MVVLIESNGYRGLFWKISLLCVSTPAGIFLVLRTLLNCLDCIILWNCYKFFLVLIVAVLLLINLLFVRYA